MAKVKDTIAKADDMRPNAIDEELKARWLYAFDAEIAETMQQQALPFVWPLEGEDAELSMPYPHDDIYLYHLCAQIDNYNQETALYENDATIANEATEAAKAWWRRLHPPRPGGYWRLAP